MRNQISTVMLLATLCCPITILAQNIQTTSVEWNCTSTFVVETGTFENEITKVVSTPQQITWYDAQDNVKKSLEITASEGTWTNVSNDGSIIFKVSSGNDSGIVLFSKKNGTMMIRIQLVLGNQVPIYDLTVSTLTAL